MKIAFRTDASVHIGAGHVMRCLTLAEALASKGAKCTFICREHEGHLIDYIQDKGHAVHRIPMESGTDTDLAHSKWLGGTQAQDVLACAPPLARLNPDWLIVDHYALDDTWEVALSPFCSRLMAIDDLSDRRHMCNLLLDQTYGRDKSAYLNLVPKKCTVLCGSDYALLRPEFPELRPYSLQRRLQPTLKHLLIAMGGMNKDNVTSQVLHALRNCPLPTDCRITVVVGAEAPWKANILEFAQTLRWDTSVCLGVTNMAELMADADLAIGAAGTSSWERCCLGLPSISMALAANQTLILTQLKKAGAVAEIQRSGLLSTLKNVPALGGDQDILSSMAHAASQICSGEGTALVVSRMMTDLDENNTTVQ